LNLRHFNQRHFDLHHLNLYHFNLHRFNFHRFNPSRIDNFHCFNLHRFNPRHIDNLDHVDNLQPILHYLLVCYDHPNSPLTSNEMVLNHIQFNRERINFHFMILKIHSVHLLNTSIYSWIN